MAGIGGGDLIAFLTQTHDFGNVLAAVVVALLSAAAGFRALQFVLGAERGAVWAPMAMAAFGLGVWATHFVAMLGYRPDLALGFTVSGIALSAGVAVAGIGGALLLGARLRSGAGDALGGAGAGAAVAAMHALGVVGLTGCAPVAALPASALGALFGGIGAAAALRALRRAQGFPLWSALWLSLGVAGLHFTAVAGLRLERIGERAGEGLSRAAVEPLTLIASLGLAAAFIVLTLIEARRDTAQRKLAAVALNIHDAVLILDPQSRATWVNPALTRLTGADLGALRGRCAIAALMGAERDPQAVDALRLAVARGAAETREVRLEDRDGAAVWVEAAVSPVRDAAGALAGAILVLHDVSEAKAREMALITAREEAEQSRRWLLAALDAMPLGLAIFDAEGRLALCNAPYRALNPGLEDALIPGAAFVGLLAATVARGLRDIGDADPQAWVGAEIARARAPGGAESEIALIDGRRVWKRTLAMATGETLALRIDVTDRVLREAELAQTRDKALAASRAKSEFISVMSHELRTPLNGVLGFAGILAFSGLSDEQKKHVDRITESGGLLLTLLNDILDAAALEADRVTLEAAPVRLADLVAEVARVHRAAAEAKGLALTADVAADAPETVTGDAARLRQILANLMGNAVKFTESGAVSLRVRPGRARGAGVEIVYEVRDTGVGIAPEAMATLFDAYAQADSSMTRGFGGVGLGLTICHRLAALMGGEIAVESAPGKGALFRVSIPHRPAQAAPAPAPLRFAARG